MKQAGEYRSVYLAGGGVIKLNSADVREASDLSGLEALGMLSMPLGLLLGVLPGDWQQLFRSRRVKREVQHASQPGKV